MKILHTSDWHLGRSLYGRKRYEEFSGFLDWLADTIEEQGVDVLLVAGDIFDTGTPSNRAQELYYRFLCRVASSPCRHVVITAGNHDSPTFLDAPREVLRALNVHVVGSVSGNPEDEVFVISGSGNSPPDAEDCAIICAVPYLRDRDIRTVEPGETADDKNRKLVEGIQGHYVEAVNAAGEKRAEILCDEGNENVPGSIPIVAMGHLFTSGGRTVDGDGVRDLYVGSLAHVEKDLFPDSIDYLALGHLHVPQSVGGAEHMRYSGSPIPIGFGEADQKKKVVLIEFNGRTPVVQELPVPCFQQLVRIAGSLDEICARLEELKREESSAWLEIEYDGSDIIGDLREMLDESLAGSSMEIRRIKNRRVMDRVLRISAEEETLDDLDAEDVFARCLDVFEVSNEEREELTVSYKEILRAIHEEDINEE